MPTAARKLRGARTDRAVRDEVKPVAMAPEAPAWVTGQAREEWDWLVPRLVEHGLVTELDRGVLGMRCIALAVAIAAGKTAETFEVETGEGGVKSAPATRVFKDYAALVRSLDAEFGLTPASRTRVSPSGEKGEEEAKNPLDALIKSAQRRTARAIAAAQTN